MAGTSDLVVSSSVTERLAFLSSWQGHLALNVFPDHDPPSSFLDAGMGLLEVVLNLSLFCLGGSVVDVDLEVIRDGAGEILLGWLVFVVALLDHLG